MDSADFSYQNLMVSNVNPMVWAQVPSANPFKMYWFNLIYQTQIPRIFADFGWEGILDLQKKKTYLLIGCTFDLLGGGVY